MKSRILFADGLSAEAERIFKSHRHKIEIDVYSTISRERLLKIIEAYDVLSVKTQTLVDLPVLLAAKKLKLIARAGVGLDHIDVKAALRRKIQIIHTPESSSIAVAELTVGLMIALARKAKWAASSIYGGRWRNFNAVGMQLSRKTLGIIGFGRIGQEVAKRMAAFGMSIVAYDPYLEKSVARPKNVKFVSLEALLKNSDIVCLHTPLTDETFHLMNRKKLRLLKPGGFLVNTARGALVEEKDILWALETEILQGYACDVFEVEPPRAQHSFLKHPQIICSPHIGAQTQEAQQNIQSLLANRIVKFVKTGKVETSPDLKWALMWNPKKFQRK